MKGSPRGGIGDEMTTRPLAYTLKPEVGSIREALHRTYAHRHEDVMATGTTLTTTGEALVPRDRNSKKPFDRRDHEFPYPEFATDANAERLHERHVYRFPDWTTTIPEARSGLEAVWASVKDPAPTSKVEPHADGRLIWDQDEQTEAAGRLAVLFGKSHEEENLQDLALSVRERALEDVWTDAVSVVENIVTIRREYARLRMASRKLIRRETGEGPKTYLDRVTRRFRTALEHYYQLSSSFQGLSGTLASWDARCQMHDVSRLQLPTVRKGGYEVSLP